MTIVMERTDNAALVAATHRGLAQVWIDFESALLQVPVIARLTSSPAADRGLSRPAAQPAPAGGRGQPLDQPRRFEPRPGA